MSISAISGSSTTQAAADSTASQSKTATATTTASTTASTTGKSDTVELSAAKLIGNSSSSSSSSTKTYDKEDTNKDGKVSVQEAVTYELAHPKKSDAKAKTSSGNAKEGDEGTTADKTADKSAATSIETYA